MIWQGYPRRVEIYVSGGKKTAAQIRKETGCDVVINGGLYDMKKMTPNCHLKVKGEVLGTDPYRYYGYGWNEGEAPRLVLDYTALENFICCVCMVREGKAEKMYYDAAVGRSAARTAMGTMPDGTLWLYADRAAKTPKQLQDIALKAGVRDAVMLDGGGSTQGIFPEGQVLSTRKVHNYLCVWAAETVTCPHCGKAVVLG